MAALGVHMPKKSTYSAEDICLHDFEMYLSIEMLYHYNHPSPQGSQTLQENYTSNYLTTMHWVE